MNNTGNTNSVRSFPLPPALLRFPITVNAIRSVEIDGKPWFVASEVCRTISIHVRQDGTVGTNNAVQKLASDEKHTLTYAEAHRMGLKEGVSRPHGITLVSEPGLYALISRSDKPAARAFDRWVRHDVLPAIRKDGAYVLGEEKVATGELSEDEFVLRAIKILQDKLDRLRAEAAKMRDELTIVTVDEWRALRHRYLTPSERLRISGRAKALHLELGVPIGVQWRTFTLPTGRVIDTKLNVYRADLIDRAALYLGIPMVAAR